MSCRGVVGVALMCALAGWASARADNAIDRHALVTRHNVTLDKPDPLTPLSVGNGEFAFTADITGLQTFPDYHQKGMSLGPLRAATRRRRTGCGPTRIVCISGRSDCTSPSPTARQS
jgi:hypothetical protein